MLDIRPIPAFDDNYIWLLTDPPCRDAVVVDPGEADPVLEALAAGGLRLTAILLTHHHGDHVGGVHELAENFPGIAIIGPHDPQIRGLTRRVGEAQEIVCPGLGHRFTVLAIPGHTPSHLAFLGEGALFCGDTLFAAGCGRVFGDTPEHLSASLRRIAALDPLTRIYCGHEYTLANLGFARWVEPDNAALHERARAAAITRAHDLPTVPSGLAEELATNPFLRTGEPQVIAAAERFAGHPLRGHAAVFTALRQWKDTEYD